METQTQESRQTRDENRAVRSGKVAPSRTFTVSGTPTNIKTREPKHEVDIDLLHELKSFSESTKSALGALGWGKLNRDGSKQKLRKRQPKLDDFTDEKKSGYQTEEGNNQLGGQAVPTEKEKLTSSLGAQNKQTKVTIREKSNYCPSCGQKKSPEMKRDYPETESQGSLCPSCRQDSQRREADAKGKKESEAIASGLHLSLIHI